MEKVKLNRSKFYEKLGNATLVKLGVDTEIPYKTLMGLVHGKYNASLRNALVIAAYLELPVEELFEVSDETIKENCNG